MPTDILPKITTGHVLSIQGILGIIRCTLAEYSSEYITNIHTLPMYDLCNCTQARYTDHAAITVINNNNNTLPADA